MLDFEVLIEELSQKEEFLFVKFIKSYHDLEIKDPSQFFDLIDNNRTEYIVSIRAYVLIVHSELESFIEDFFTKLISSICDDWIINDIVNPMLLSLLISSDFQVFDVYNAPNSTFKDRIAYDMKEFIKDYKKKIIDENHGIKKSNIEKMIYPLKRHIDYHDNSMLLFQLVENFGKLRGTYAHHSTSLNRIGLENENSAIEIKKLVNQIISELTRVFHEEDQFNYFQFYNR